MMIDIAQHNTGEWISLKDISRRQGVSVKYLEQIANALNKSGLLVSSRGPQGGYMLAKAPEKYTVGHILRAIEGSLSPVACLETEVNTCERKDFCSTLGFWKGLYKVINDYVDSVTLRDLVNQVEETSDYCI